MNRASGRAFPLLLAALNDHEAVVEHLLTANADPNQIQKKSGAFPLLMAALNGHEAVVGRLLCAFRRKRPLIPIQNGHFGRGSNLAS